MKIAYISLAIIVVAVLVVYIARSASKKSPNDNGAEGDTVKTQTHTTELNKFQDLRSMALSITAEQLGIILPLDKTVVYGVVMDWEIGDGIVTLVSYKTGDASLYLSSGGGIIGGGQYANVNAAARQYVEKAQSFLVNADKTTTTTNLPAKNELHFYLLTNKGVFLGKEEISNIENNSSQWIDLFTEANIVITELRNISSE